MKPRLRQRAPAPACCRDCGLSFLDTRHAGYGYCNACYRWHRQRGWDAQRPVPSTHCRDCGQPWGPTIRKHGYERCMMCYLRWYRVRRAVLR